MFDAADLATQRRINRRLRQVPRLGVLGFRRRLAQVALWLGAINADQRLRRRRMTVENRTVVADGQAIRIRIIRPDRPTLGILVDFHGGAWALGRPTMDDKLNAAIADRCGLAVVSIDYRLAMPRPIAALQRECTAGLTWVLEQTDGDLSRGPVIVTGESAGAHLAVSALTRLSSLEPAKRRIAGALLHYGAYNLGGSESARRADADTLILHGPSLTRQIEALLPGLDEDQRRAPDLSPLFADLAGLPPCFLIVGDIDPLRDDSTALAERLSAAGVDTRLQILPGAPHGVIHLNGTYAAKVRAMGHAWIAERIAAVALEDRLNHATVPASTTPATTSDVPGWRPTAA